MNQLENTLLEMSKRLTAYKAFLIKWGDKLNDAGSFGQATSKPEYYRYCYGDEDRNTILAEMAETFGRDGWKRELMYHKQAYKWSKEVDGVTVEISDAEVIPPPVKPEAVSPKEFPLQLTDAS